MADLCSRIVALMVAVARMAMIALCAGTLRNPHHEAKKTSRLRRPRNHAYHEAAHLIVALVVGIPASGAQITANDGAMFHGMHFYIRSTATWVDYVTVILAGGVGGACRTITRFRGDSGDWEILNQLVPKKSKKHICMVAERRARGAVHRYRHLIDRVARELLKRKVIVRGQKKIPIRA